MALPVTRPHPADGDEQRADGGERHGGAAGRKTNAGTGMPLRAVAPAAIADDQQAGERHPAGEAVHRGRTGRVDEAAARQPAHAATCAR
jgi:hypothetical protein